MSGSQVSGGFCSQMHLSIDSQVAVPLTVSTLFPEIQAEAELCARITLVVAG